MKLGHFLTPDDWNAHNANLVIHPAGRFDEKWSAPTIVELGVTQLGVGFTFTRKKFTNADRISCGEPWDAVGANTMVVPISTASRAGCNVCRPFDEAHMMGCGNWKISRSLYPKLAAYCLAEKIGVPTRQVADAVTRITPRNHGAGALCVCLKWKADGFAPNENGVVLGKFSGDAMVCVARNKGEAFRKARVGETILVKGGTHTINFQRGFKMYILHATPKKRCRWCNGSGRVDYDQCGRGDPSRHNMSASMKAAQLKYYRIR